MNDQAIIKNIILSFPMSSDMRESIENLKPLFLDVAQQAIKLARSDERAKIKEELRELYEDTCDREEIKYDEWEDAEVLSINSIMKALDGEQ